jgi:hypothetical protein
MRFSSCKRTFVPVVLWFAAACGPADLEILDGLEREEGLELIASGPARGYQRPAGLEGATDQLNPPPNVAAARWSRLRDLGLGFKEYNLYWSSLEPGQVSTATPVGCAPGLEQIPANEAERQALGYHRFRCIHPGFLAYYDTMFALDVAYGLQSVVVLWSAPPAYRYPGCSGAPWSGAIMKDGCVPRDDVMDDFEDFVTLVASRWNGSRGGRIRHFIVWNESGSGLWFDYSPVVPTRGPLPAYNPADPNNPTTRWVRKHAEMIRRAASAVSRHASGVMLYASTDLWWLPPPDQTITHIGSKAILDGLWDVLGADVDWSLAIHPYGDPNVPATPYGTYGFYDLSRQTTYQANQLITHGRYDNPLRYPQYQLIASEQLPFDPNNLDQNARAIALCHAHARALRYPNLIGVNHNHFQAGADPADVFGIIPFSAGEDLAGLWATPTGAAYAAMSPAVWGQRDTNNFCCEVAGTGCASAPAFGSAASNNVLWEAQLAIDGTPQSCYSSNVLDPPNSAGAFLGAWLPQRRLITEIVLTPRFDAYGRPIALPNAFHVYVTSPDNTRWIYAGPFMPWVTGGTAVLKLWQAYLTYGVLLIPSSVATDGNAYYFQLCDLRVR